MKGYIRRAEGPMPLLQSIPMVLILGIKNTRFNDTELYIVPFLEYTTITHSARE